MTNGSGETPNSASNERLNSEPSALNTKIEIQGLSRLPQLEAHLRAYRDRNRAFAAQATSGEQDATDLVYSADRQVSVFEETILGVVLTLAAQKDRDFTDRPILLSTVADETMSITGTDVSRSTSVPFGYNSERGSYEPDLEELFDRVLRGEVTFDDVAFLEAYVTVRKLVEATTQGSASPTNVPGEISPAE